jgi:hypothetical protein
MYAFSFVLSTARHRGCLGADPGPEAAASATPPQCRHGIADPGCQDVRGRAGIPRWRRFITCVSSARDADPRQLSVKIAKRLIGQTARACPRRLCRPRDRIARSALRNGPTKANN